MALKVTMGCVPGDEHKRRAFLELWDKNRAILEARRKRIDEIPQPWRNKMLWRLINFK
tara:strand:- start:727 stop:900 length:174 start_codon:yes stop_codon:yes gene_type:complete